MEGEDLEIKIVGLVGTGALGRALLERCIAAGLVTQTYDVSTSATEAVRALGATIVDSPRSAAYNADCVHVCVRSDEEAIEAVLGSNGALCGLGKGALLLLHSTMLPETTQLIGAAAAPLGVDVLDATVLGVPSAIRAGSACFLLGGADTVVERTRPYLLRLVRAVYHFGALGAGNVAKIAKNLATAADRVVLVEAVALAEAGGVDPGTLLNMMRAEFSPTSEQWEDAFTIASGHAKPRPTTNLLGKDIGLAATFAAERGLVLPVTRSVAETAAHFVSIWNANDDVTIERLPPLE